MENQVMDQLLEKFKKNSKLSKTDMTSFEENLMNILKEQGINDYSVNYLLTGPGDISMKTLTCYIKGKTDVNECVSLINDFVNCKRMSENTGGTASVKLIYLVTSFIEYHISDVKLFSTAFIRMVNTSFKNDGSGINKKAQELLASHLIPIMSASKGLHIDLSFISSENVWKKTKQLFIESAYSDMKMPAEMKEGVYRWLSGAGKDIEPYSDIYIKNKFLQKKQEIIVPDDLTKNVSAPSVTAWDKNGDTKQMKFNLNHAVKNLIILATAQTKAINILDEKEGILQETVNKLQKELLKAVLNEKTQEEQISVLLNEKTELINNNRELVTIKTELEDAVEKLRMEIDEQKQFTDVVAKNREKQAGEYINKLAASLKIEHDDFEDAQGLDMSLDLGENLRDQIARIFKILEKNGITL
jgi:hypothetical protein